MGSIAEESSSEASLVDENRRRFEGLRSLQWRINLGILPSCYSSSVSIDELRRVTADSRRRYAGLRRSLLVDPHNPKDGINAPNLVMDNPLSQNPDSTWSRFFQNAELEKMVNQDLSRLYPEHGNYFQDTGCQGMLRRILSLWCLRHPEYGYRQGMHELLAPLLYVLQADLERLSDVRKLYEDQFTDQFDGILLLESNLSNNYEFKKFPGPSKDNNNSAENSKVRSLDELDPGTKTIVLLSDAYGAEGELGVVFSEKFMEHDAYCMFDALMSGSNGAVAMADFFASSSAGGSQLTVPPVIEASAALYQLLSVVDSSVHSHLVELGVEPHYFALRWLRVLFGREFSLAKLLIIWDEIFASDNRGLEMSDDDADVGFRILNSPRGAFIAALAVSMILYIRSSLLATEHATSCLQRLLNFPENVDLNKLIDKARSLQILVLDSNIMSSFGSAKGNHNRRHSVPVGGNKLQFDFDPQITPRSMVSESYWEEKWRNLHSAEERKQGHSGEQYPAPKRGWTEKVKLRLYRAESDPSPVKLDNSRKNQKSSVKRNLFEDLSRALESKDDRNVRSHGDAGKSEHVEGQLTTEVRVKRQDEISEDAELSAEETFPTGKNGNEENNIMFSGQTSPLENDSEKSSVASNLSHDESDGHLQGATGKSTHAVITPPEDLYSQSPDHNSYTEKSATGFKERRSLSGKFQRIWKFGRKATADGPSGKEEYASDVTLSVDNEGTLHSTLDPSMAVESGRSSVSSRGDALDQNAIDNLKNLGQSMQEHIQVLESVFQQDQSQEGSMENSENVVIAKGQIRASMTELRRISKILSEM